MIHRIRERLAALEKRSSGVGPFRPASDFLTLNNSSFRFPNEDDWGGTVPENCFLNGQLLHLETMIISGVEVPSGNGVGIGSLREEFRPVSMWNTLQPMWTLGESGFVASSVYIDSGSGGITYQLPVDQSLTEDTWFWIKANILLSA